MFIFRYCVPIGLTGLLLMSVGFISIMLLCVADACDNSDLNKCEAYRILMGFFLKMIYIGMFTSVSGMFVFFLKIIWEPFI